MLKLDRTNTSLMGQWWWTVDRYSLLAVSLLIAIGIVVLMAASPSIATRMGFPPFFFVHRQIVFLAISLPVMFVFSVLSPVVIRRVSVLGFLVSIVLMAMVPLVGIEVKGAFRWLSVFGFTIQPSEFLKPFFVVVIAWVLVQKNIRENYPGYRIIAVLLGIVSVLLVLQPDISAVLMTAVVCAAQLFMAGLSLVWVAFVTLIGIIALVGSYVFFPYVAARINSFLDPGTGNTYQNEKALEAFINGGLFGRGPGEGVIKDIIPDAHTDFIFAVAGEEFGLLLCIVIAVVFAFIVIRGFLLLLKDSDLFVIYACSGLLIQFGLQAIINMGVTLNLLPNTGMTLPFISYGGSSVLSTAITMGMIFAFTRRRFGKVG